MIPVSKFSEETMNNLHAWMIKNNRQYIVAPWNREGSNEKPDEVIHQAISNEDYIEWFNQFQSKELQQKKSFVHCKECSNPSDCGMLEFCTNKFTKLDEPEKALRYNEGKVKWSLVHFKSLEPMVRVLEAGAKKYSPDNWKKGLDKKEILESMMRHLTALIDGENCDPGTGLPHMGHIQCNALFFNYFDNKENEKTSNNKL